METKSGFVAIIGRPNVGKSTLLNALLDKKISITSHKPQTTRHQIKGIWTQDNTQCVFVDTPGYHLGGKKALNQLMNKASKSALNDIDVILVLVDSLVITPEDEQVFKMVANSKAPKILVINKIDKVKHREKLLPHIAKLQSMCNFSDVVPLSALKDAQSKRLFSIIEGYLPNDVFYYPIEQSVSQSPLFQAQELIREKLYWHLADELPYESSVQVETFENTDKLLSIEAIIWVQREGQKAIVIGDNGVTLKEIGTMARRDLEHYFDKKVMLRLWARVKDSWSDDLKALGNMGYSDF